MERWGGNRHSISMIFLFHVYDIQSTDNHLFRMLVNLCNCFLFFTICIYIFIYRMQTRHFLVRSLQGHADAVTKLAIDENRSVLFGADKTTVYLWDLSVMLNLSLH